MGWLGWALGCVREPDLVDPGPAPVETSTPTGDTGGGPDDTDTGEAPEVVPTLTLHPELRSIVVASWDQPVAADVWVEYSVDPGVWRTTPVRAVPAGPVDQQLLGLPYDASVEVRVVWDGANGLVGPGVTTTTDPLPAGFPEPTLRADLPGQWSDGAWLLGSINGVDGGWTAGPYWMFVLDRAGRVVWARRAVDDHMTIYLRVSLDGDLLWDESTFWADFDGGAGSKIHRMKIDGSGLETVDAPGMHHCFLEREDHSLVWGAANGFTSERLLRRWPDGTVSTEWDCAPFYDSLGLTDWCHTNSIVYDALTDRYLLSFPTDDTFVLEVDAATGEEVRWFGHVPGSWSFDAPASAFQYQHGVTWTDARTLLMSSQLTGSNPDALVREYVLDEATTTLTQVWAFGAGDGIDADNAGEAHRLPNGNTLHNTGTTPRVREITPEGAVVWDVSWTGSKLLGRTIWLEDLYALAP